MTIYMLGQQNQSASHRQGSLLLYEFFSISLYFLHAALFLRFPYTYINMKVIMTWKFILEHIRFPRLENFIRKDFTFVNSHPKITHLEQDLQTTTKGTHNRSSGLYVIVLPLFALPPLPLFFCVLIIAVRQTPPLG